MGASGVGEPGYPAGLITRRSVEPRAPNSNPHL